MIDSNPRRSLFDRQCLYKYQLVLLIGVTGTIGGSYGELLTSTCEWFSFADANDSH